jgi:histidyl-tRNA synthetase
MTRPLIKPQTLKGFRDYLPSQAMAREQILEVARKVYRSYGFSPIDTPALEYAEILLGKGGAESDRQLFRFTDQGGRDVALRFDLTVPFARFAAQHLNEIGTPFKRYHFGLVWRGENTQRGRYREFMQSDFDTIGSESNAADVETLLVIHDLFEALGFERFTIRVNNRLVLNGLLEKLGFAGKAKDILIALDKLRKIGKTGVQAEIVARTGVPPDQATKVVELLSLTSQATRLSLELAQAAGSSPESILTRLSDQVQGSVGEEGVSRLRELFAAASAAGIPADRVSLDLSIARGLDYYTGTIYETFLTDDESIGSVCSGGRYDNLAELFTSQKLPGVGASLGVDRLLAAMENMGRIASSSTPAPVLVVLFDQNRLGDYLRIGRTLRAAGINAEVFPDARGVGKQLKYADRKGFRVALIAGEEEFKTGVWQVKDLKSEEQTSVAESALVEHISRIV